MQPSKLGSTGASTGAAAPLSLGIADHLAHLLAIALPGDRDRAEAERLHRPFLGGVVMRAAGLVLERAPRDAQRSRERMQFVERVGHQVRTAPDARLHVGVVDVYGHAMRRPVMLRLSHAA